MSVPPTFYKPNAVSDFQKSTHTKGSDVRSRKLAHSQIQFNLLLTEQKGNESVYEYPYAYTKGEKQTKTST